MWAISFFFEVLFFLIAGYFALYVLLEFKILLVSRRVERRKLTALGESADLSDGADLPTVSVLLPICNESSVVERLIDAVCKLRYPAGRVDILVLDDSTDGTSDLAAARVSFHAAAGVNIRLLKREDRRGFKAGNLTFGIRYSQGEFLAIFDADFIPPNDFLLRTIPRFRDESLGFLQTGIGYINRDASFLTRFQAMEMGHQQFVTVGLSADGDMASLSGSSCVWRRHCIESLGGYNASVITEDVDLGYRAQISDWQYAYLRDVVSLSELPESVSAFRVQRERWGRGLIHSAFKHAGQMFRKKMPVVKRMHAISMMFSSLLLASIYVLLLVSLPLGWVGNYEGEAYQWGAVGFFLVVGVWLISNYIGSREGANLAGKRSVFKVLSDMYIYVAMFLPMSLYYFVGGVRAFRGVTGEFNRTPKGLREQMGSKPKINRMLIAGEVFSFVYAGLATLVAVLQENYFLVPLDVTGCFGFGMVLYETGKERRLASKPPSPRHKPGSSSLDLLDSGVCRNDESA